MLSSVAGVIALNWLSKSHLRQILVAEERQVDIVHQSVIDAYKTHADLLFYNRIDRKEILSIFSNAQTAPENSRKRLYGALVDMYEHMSMFQLKQLHFHLPDNRSFLRFHRPGKYGDDLTAIRNTVNYVNQNLTPVTGFEEGRIFNGYRFVYPLFYEKRHLGSVETSVSMKMITNDLSKLLDADIEFFIDKNVVERKVFESERSNYEASKYIKGHLVEKRTAGESPSLVDKILEENRDIFETYAAKMKEGKTFSIVQSLNNSKYMLTIMPINQAITHERVASLIVVKKHSELNLLFIKELIVMIVIILLISIVSYVLYKLEIRNTIIEKISITDALTKISNRRHFEDVVRQEIGRARRSENYFSFLMLDLDYFKEYNDTYGHQEGDNVLINVAKVLQELTHRADDSCFRLGGEEFGVLFIGLDPEASLHYANTFKTAIEALKIPHDSSSAGKYVSASFGLVTMKANRDIDPDALYREADKLLYKAKQGGRNQIATSFS